MAEVYALSGVQRAAVVLLSLGEQQAAEVLKHMGAKEVQKLGVAMTSVGSVSRDEVEKVIDEFVDTLERPSLGSGADEYVRAVLVQALGEDRASSLIDRILMGRNTTGLDTLKWMEPRAIADLVLNELNDVMAKQFAGNQNLKSSSIGGVKVAANILNFMDGGMDETILGDIAQIDEALTGKIRDLMFVFDNLAEIDDRAMQTVLREVAADKLALALRGADSKVKDKIIGNMSQRAAEMLVEDMEARGPVRLAEVEAAQKEILAIVRKLSEDGTIQLAAKAEVFV